MFSNLYNFMLFLYGRTLDKVIHWHVLNGKFDNDYVIESYFFNEKNKKSYTVSLTTENNILTIKSGSHTQSNKNYGFEIKEEDLIETKNTIINFVIQNSEFESDEVLFRNIVQSKYL